MGDSMATIENPTIVIPCMKGSSLENYYTVAPTMTWTEFDAAKAVASNAVEAKAAALMHK
jgi:hypothetical protein